MSNILRRFTKDYNKGFGFLSEVAQEVRRMLAHQKINEQKIEEQTKEIERLRTSAVEHREDVLRQLAMAAALKTEVERLRAVDALCYGKWQYEDVPLLARDLLAALEEIERLRAELSKTCTEKAEAHLEIDRLEARIDAALDWLKPWADKMPINPASTAIFEAVEALKGVEK